jgi:vacuolar-type H+-ATPase subunit I/STV1
MILSVGQNILYGSTQNLKSMMLKWEDKESREYNIILHNIPESESDNADKRNQHDENEFQKVVSALLKTQDEIKINRIFRLGKRPEVNKNTDDRRSASRPRLMLIKLEDKAHVHVLMKNRMRLKEVGFKNVYMTQDRLPEEREPQKILEMQKKIDRLNLEKEDLISQHKNDMDRIDRLHHTKDKVLNVGFDILLNTSKKTREIHNMIDNFRLRAAGKEELEELDEPNYNIYNPPNRDILVEIQELMDLIRKQNEDMAEDFRQQIREKDNWIIVLLNKCEPNGTHQFTSHLPNCATCIEFTWNLPNFAKCVE